MKEKQQIDLGICYTVRVCMRSWNERRGRDMIWNCFMVGLGGFVGSILRYLVGLLPLDTGNGFPIKTFLINLIGAFLLGFLSVCLGKRVDLQP